MSPVAFPSTETYTYKPGTPPPSQDWSATQAYTRGEEMNATAERTRDFFQAADNGDRDLDPRAGYVRLKNAEAPGLLERVTTTVDGWSTPNGDLQVTGQNDNNFPATSLVITGNGQEVMLDRPWYLNDRYMSTLESLSHNGDGTRTISGSYYNHLG